MRQAVLLLAATSAALVTPDKVRSQQISFESQDKTAQQNAVQAWWDAVPNAGSLLSPIEDRISKTIQHTGLESFLALLGGSGHEDEDHPHPPRPPHPPRGGHGRHGHHGDPDKTIYELIKESKHTTKFAKLVEEHDEIKQLLEDTKHNHTLFVPTDRAFKRIPHRRHGHHGKDGDDKDDDKHDHKPSKEFILALLKYHIAPGLYPVHRVHASRTIPTELHPAALDSSVSDSHHHEGKNHPQRIRAFTTPFIHRTRLNFHARLLPGDIPAKNGLIHAVDSLLIPPPSQVSIIRLLPAQFSTLALALETTGLADELENLPRSGGGTLFAPTNRAWARLGPRVNAFLFSEHGKKYLRALVRYHVVVNETVYSDAYYRGGGEDGKESGGGGGGYWHVDLPTLLGGKPVSVDVKTWRGFVSVVVNGFVKVVVRDGVADDGVVQVVGRVLIPPCGHRGGEEAEDMSVEEFKSRLEPYMEGSEESKESEGPEELETSGEQKNMGDL
ncbi:fasciclin domain protein [Parachaetomium inaequale]|uniref:Fasciclin domain protein n=1 Tax=Parachaetomium inaequale TaxID=2588326 RepID=A0AAN6STS7_9PEZI|nr:fasciclin domain protein [Parachaetomium inaequale]